MEIKNSMPHWNRFSNYNSTLITCYVFIALLVYYSWSECLIIIKNPSITMKQIHTDMVNNNKAQGRTHVHILEEKYFLVRVGIQACFLTIIYYFCVNLVYNKAHPVSWQVDLLNWEVAIWLESLDLMKVNYNK